MPLVVHVCAGIVGFVPKQIDYLIEKININNTSSVSSSQYVTQFLLNTVFKYTLVDFESNTFAETSNVLNVSMEIFKVSVLLTVPFPPDLKRLYK